MATKLNIGMVGYGFMGRAHSNAYHRANQFFELAYHPVLKIVAGQTRDKVDDFAQRWGWQRAVTDWRRVVESPEIDAVDIVSPNSTHYPIALAAAAAGKLVLCEKPLAMNVAEAREMTEAVERSGKPSMVWFNYRRVPAIRLARQIIDEGRLGKIYHYRSTYLQDWGMSRSLVLGGPLGWRFDQEFSGGGTSVDTASHMIDTAVWLNGPIARLCAMTETFVRDRPRPDGSPARVEVDDACTFLARFANGSNGTFEATRFARGRKNVKGFEVNGEDGSVCFDLGQMHELQFFQHDDPTHLRGWRTINVTAHEHPYMSNWWVPGCVTGYEHTFVNALADYLQALAQGERFRPDFRDALETQSVVETVMASARSEKWLSPAPAILSS